MLKYIIRLDDACPNMKKDNWERVEKLLDKYNIKPIYNNQNLIIGEFSGIFQIKMIHIINIYVLKRKEGVKKNERTSHRRSYDYSYE